MQIVRPDGAVRRVGVRALRRDSGHGADVPWKRDRERRVGAVARLHRGTDAGRSRWAHSAGAYFDRTVGLDEVPDGYRAMNEREPIKVIIEREPIKVMIEREPIKVMIEL
jgi:hypothetical protein